MIKYFKNLLRILKKLRSKKGCPWDREQTPHSLRKSLLEESFELIDSIQKNDNTKIKEELGDCLLNIMLIAYICEQEKRFSIKSMLHVLTDKLIVRHPHVFKKRNKISTNEVLLQWQKIKQNDRSKSQKSLLSDIQTSIDKLEEAYQIQKRAASIGFDWNAASEVMGKLQEEIKEFSEALQTQEQQKMEEELGDLLFTIVNLSRKCNIQPTIALHRANQKFLTRFQKVEQAMQQKNLSLCSENMPAMQAIWDLNKKEEKFIK